MRKTGEQRSRKNTDLKRSGPKIVIILPKDWPRTRNNPASRNDVQHVQNQIGCVDCLFDGRAACLDDVLLVGSDGCWQSGQIRQSRSRGFWNCLVSHNRRRSVARGGQHCKRGGKNPKGFSLCFRSHQMLIGLLRSRHGSWTVPGDVRELLDLGKLVSSAVRQAGGPALGPD